MDTRQSSADWPAEVKAMLPPPEGVRPFVTLDIDFDKVIITLDHPAKVTHPNGRTRNYKYRAAAVKKDRDMAALLARCSVVRCPETKTRDWSKATIDLHWIGITKRADSSNLQGWVKAYVDGIADVLNNGQDNGWEFGTVTREPSRERKFVRLTVRRIT